MPFVVNTPVSRETLCQAGVLIPPHRERGEFDADFDRLLWLFYIYLLRDVNTPHEKLLNSSEKKGDRRHQID